MKQNNYFLFFIFLRSCKEDKGKETVREIAGGQKGEGSRRSIVTTGQCLGGMGEVWKERE